MKLGRTTLILALLALAGAAQATPFEEVKGTEDYRVGNSDWNGGAAFGARMRRGQLSSSIPDSAEAYAYASGYATLFGQRFDLISFSSYSRLLLTSGGSTKSTNWTRMTALGVYVSNDSGFGSTDDQKKFNFYEHESSVGIWILRVTVRSYVGVGAAVDLERTNYWNGVKMAGNAHVYTYGGSSIAVGVPGFDVGVRGELRFFDTVMLLGMQPHYHVLQGTASNWTSAARAVIQVFVEMGIWPAKYEITKDLVNVGLPYKFNKLIWIS